MVDYVWSKEPGFSCGYPWVDGRPTVKFASGNLDDFDGRGKYSNLEFSCGKYHIDFTVTPTATKFLNSDKVGEQYMYDMVITDIKNGNISN